MKETLQAIFTPEAGGGTVVNYPLERIGPALKSIQTIEDFLLFDYLKDWAERDESGAISAGQWLTKISICIYSEEPEKWAYLFADGWNGKFFYDPKLLN